MFQTFKREARDIELSTLSNVSEEQRLENCWIKLCLENSTFSRLGKYGMDMHRSAFPPDFQGGNPNKFKTLLHTGVTNKVSLSVIHWTFEWSILAGNRPSENWTIQILDTLNQSGSQIVSLSWTIFWNRNFFFYN